MEPLEEYFYASVITYVNMYQTCTGKVLEIPADDPEDGACILCCEDVHQERSREKFKNYALVHMHW